jgi:hypothetical protein
MPRRRSDVLTVIDEVQPLVNRYYELSEAHKAVFLDMVDPLPDEVGVPTKKPKRKRSSKSPAVGKLPRCANCNAWEINPIHDRTANHPDYHAFIAKSAGKSARAASLGEAIKKTPKNNVGDDDEFPDLLGGHEPCVFDIYGQQCGAASDANIHHLQNVEGYHEFQPAQQSAATGD